MPFGSALVSLCVSQTLYGHSVREGVYLCGILGALSIFLLGEGDYSRFKPSGPFKVIGLRTFTSKTHSNTCSVYYPAVEDGSGAYGLPYASSADFEKAL